MATKTSKPSASKAAPHAAMSLAEAGTAVQEGIASSLSDIQHIEADIVQLVRSTVADTLGAGGTVGHQLTDVISALVRSAIEAVEKNGTGMSLSARNIARGMVTGVHDVGGDVIEAAFQTARALVRQSANLGADVATVARHAVAGVIAGAAQTGADVGKVAQRAADGAISGAGEVGTLASHTVRQVLVGMTGDLRAVMGAATPAGAEAAHSTARH